jgi:hypothetical protein
MLKIKEEFKNTILQGAGLGYASLEVAKIDESQFPYYSIKFPWIFEEIEEKPVEELKKEKK